MAPQGDSEVSVVRQAVAYLVGIGVAELAGGIGSLSITPESFAWYTTLAKPPWTPPSWLFGLVWTLLFALNGAAAARVWLFRHRLLRARVSLALLAANLLCNAVWPAMFFGLRSPAAGLACTVAALSCAVVLACWWWRLERPAALLLAPYVAWVAYAVVLGVAIVSMN